MEASALAVDGCGHREEKRSSSACFYWRQRARQSNYVQHIKYIYIYIYIYICIFGVSTRIIPLLRSSFSFHNRKKYLALVQKTTNSSAWNHIFKTQRRGPPRRRTRKVLSLWQTHGSAPRSSYLPCQRWLHGNARSYVEQRTERPQQRKRIWFQCLCCREFGNAFFLWAVQHQVIA